MASALSSSTCCSVGLSVISVRTYDCYVIHVVYQGRNRAGAQDGAESVLTLDRLTCHLPAETTRWLTITQIYEGTNQIQRMVMARQLLKR
jgi:hypothetical protein